MRPDQQSKHQRIVIVGGGTTGWITACALGKQLSQERYQITLIESSQIGTVGVGEAVIPTFVNFIRGLGINEQEFIQATQATFKLGIKFQDWKTQGQDYFHHFGGLGQTLDGHRFLHCWLQAKQNGDDAELMDYSPSAVMAKHHRFFLPFKASQTSSIIDASYAYQFDASKVGAFLRKHAGQQGVTRIDGKVTRVNKLDNGDIESLVLRDNTVVQGDIFLDCSGFRGLLINQTLEVGFNDWRHYLPCDRAVTVQTRLGDELPPYTTSTACDAGWTWHIPLQHRAGNGYVFNSSECSDDRALDTLLKQTRGKVLNEPNIISFVAGMRTKFWERNCIALGLAGGFLEPLESTAIHLVTRGVQFLLELFPDNDHSGPVRAALANEYNRRMQRDYEEIRDFLILHYCATQRDDTPFWRQCQSLPIPDSLQNKIELYSAMGILPSDADDLFKEVSWQAVFTGMGVLPEQRHPFLAMSDFNQIHAAMKSGREHIHSDVMSLPTHSQFIHEHCKAPQD